MSGLVDSRGGTTYKLLLVTPSGREYMVSLVSMGAFNDTPPFVVWEREDGFLESSERTYSSLSHLAAEHGCIVGYSTSVAQVN